MSFFLPTKLQTFFWEIKNRSFYIAVSFFFSFVISYQNSTSLLYLFVLSYKTNNLFDGLTLSGEEFSLFELKNGNNFIVSDIKEVEFLLSNVSNFSFSSLLYFYKILKNNDISCMKLFFIFTDVEEAFSSQIFICLFFCFIIIIPILFYESFSLVIPSLHFFEKQKWVSRITTTVIVWYFFLYNVQYTLIPRLADFLLKFQISSSGFSIIGQTKINSYCFWAITLLIGSSIIFLFFCLIFFSVIAQKIEIEYFTRRRNISRAVILLLSALISPSEVQLILAFVALSFFELAIYFFFFYKNFSYLAHNRSEKPQMQHTWRFLYTFTRLIIVFKKRLHFLIAQWLERTAVNRQAVGSKPT